MIEITHVTKTYGATVVVDDVSLALPGGALTAIIGPNGAGKSTLLSIVARLVPADRGRVRVAGLDVTTTPGDRLALRLAVLRQDNHLVARLTVADLVAFGRYPHSRGRLTDGDRAMIARALEWFGLAGLENCFLDELSGGQRQRAFVAMAMAQDTDCLLLDEPLNSLDIRHAVEMMRLLRRAVDELGKTVVVVLHDINFAASYADRVVAMKNGRVALDGAPDDLMTAEVIGDIYEIEVDIHQAGGRRIGVFRP